MTAKDAPRDGADLASITSLSADTCGRPAGKANYTPPATADTGFDGFDDDAAADTGNPPEAFTDTGFDGFDDDAKGPATVDLIGKLESDDDDDLPAA